MALYLRYAVRSDLGLVRTNNEDSVYAGPRLLAIADGMGGHAAGEVASKIVIGALEPLDEDRRLQDLMAALRTHVAAANQGIADAVAQRHELDGMGTTLTALRFTGAQVGLVHVGDSRAYLLRNDQLSQITHDDTYVQYLVDEGKLTPDEAKDHPRKSVILRALLGTEVEPDVSIREARNGDRYLLCSDGLSDVVSTETILDTLRIEDPQDAADRLVELALRGGGPDNVTVIVADVVNAKVGDIIDDVPVVAGAFVDPAAADVPGSDSAAGRAALMSRQHSRKDAAEPAAPEPTGRSWSWKPWLVVAGVIALVVAGLGGTYAWAQSQYFVGRADSDVAIYRGVNTEFGPVKFFNVYKVSDLKVTDLNPSVRSQLQGGITASGRNDAEGILKNLRHERLPLCRTLHVLPSTSGSATASDQGSGQPATTAPGSRSGSAASGSAASGSVSPPATPSPSGSPSTAASRTSGRSASVGASASRHVSAAGTHATRRPTAGASGSGSAAPSPTPSPSTRTVRQSPKSGCRR